MKNCVDQRTRCSTENNLCKNITLIPYCANLVNWYKYGKLQDPGRRLRLQCARPHIAGTR